MAAPPAPPKETGESSKSTKTMGAKTIPPRPPAAPAPPVPAELAKPNTAASGAGQPQSHLSQTQHDHPWSGTAWSPQCRSHPSQTHPGPTTPALRSPTKPGSTGPTSTETNPAQPLQHPTALSELPPVQELGQAQHRCPGPSASPMLWGPHSTARAGQLLLHQNQPCRQPLDLQNTWKGLGRAWSPVCTGEEGQEPHSRVPEHRSWAG